MNICHMSTIMELLSIPLSREKVYMFADLEEQGVRKRLWRHRRQAEKGRARPGSNPRL